MAAEPRRLIVGISGASCVIYGVRLLELLRGTGIETHLVMSKSAELTLAYETNYKPKDVKALASVAHPPSDIGAAISSGSFPTMGMVIAPCSIRTMSEIATGVTSSLLSRAADVVLKEKRRLVLALRETPLHAAENGGRHHQSHRRALARPVWNRDQGGQTLAGRAAARLTHPYPGSNAAAARRARTRLRARWHWGRRVAGPRSCNPRWPSGLPARPANQ
jgi:polyprenyl P-hydroxybenzoate/phenylacrylic acid decarboxylase-like protein